MHPFNAFNCHLLAFTSEQDGGLCKMLILLIRNPIVKFAHCQQLPTVQTREIVIVGNGQNLQWDLMSKINILRS